MHHDTPTKDAPMTKLSHNAARLTLAKQRQMTSLLDKEIAAVSSDMMFYKADWVPLYFDRGNKIISDCGQIWAFRAITLQGQFLWLVFNKDKVHGYHGLTKDPHEAIEMANASWAHRRVVRQDWDIVESAARALILGRLHFDVRAEDLHRRAEPLDDLDRVFPNRQNITAARHGFDQQLRHQLIAQRIAQAFNAGGTRRLVAIGGGAARNHPFDFSACQHLVIHPRLGQNGQGFNARLGQRKL
jgi:hypothetical protein